MEHVKIAITTFAFKNPDIINLLKERGDIIKNERWKEMEAIDQDINKIKKEKIDDLMTPVAVFMTFECEEGVNRAMAYNEIVEKDESLSHLRTWLGHHTFEIKKAPEPSDIIWENRHFTTFDRLKQKVKNFIWIFLLLTISFACVYIGAVYSLNSLYTYPDVNCDSLPLINSPQLMEDAAFREWTENQHLEKATTERIVYYGYVQCFCDSRAEAGDLPSDLYQGQPICQDYHESQFTKFFARNSISVSISVTNIIIREIIVELVKKIGYDTHSELAAQTTHAYFLSMFLNTAILILLVYANFSEIGMDFMKGPFYDYSPEWYAIVGYSIIQTMIISAFFPLIFETMPIVQSWFRQRMDQGFTRDNDRLYTTKTTQIY